MGVPEAVHTFGPDTSMTSLHASGLHLGYDRTPVVHDVSLSIAPGRVTALIGPNGSGKSTVLRSLARLHPLGAGTVAVESADSSTPATALSAREFARTVTLLSQSRPHPSGLSVREIVAFGRHPHRRRFSSLTDTDRAAIDTALELTGIAQMADRSVDQLSGGELQRVWLATCLAQETGVLLLDEPTNHLDLRYQAEILDLMRDLADDRGTAVGVVLHDLNHAAAVADDIVLLSHGRIRSMGTCGGGLHRRGSHRGLWPPDHHALRRRHRNDPHRGTSSSSPILSSGGDLSTDELSAGGACIAVPPSRLTTRHKPHHTGHTAPQSSPLPSTALHRHYLNHVQKEVMSLSTLSPTPRRTPVLVFAAVSATCALALSACGTTATDASAEDGAAKSTSEACADDSGTTSADPVSVKDDTGHTIELDKPASTVVSLEWQYTEDLLSLCVDPAAVADAKGFTTWDTAGEAARGHRGRRYPAGAECGVDPLSQPRSRHHRVDEPR